MVRACSALNCSNRYFPGNPSAFHKFPLQDKARLREWVKNMQRKDFTPTNTCYLCSVHFEDTSYWEGHSVKLLKDCAVPTIFDFKTSNKKKSRKRRISKETSKDDSSESDYLTSGKKTTLKCKKKNKNDHTTFSTDIVKKNKIGRKLEISDTYTDSISDVDSISFIDEKLIDNNSSGEIIIFNIDSDQELDLIKDKYVKADRSYVWPVQSNDLIETTDKQLLSGVAVCKKRSMKSVDLNKSIDNMESAVISNDFYEKTLDFDLANCNRIPDSQIVQNECNTSYLKLNNSNESKIIAELDFETDVFKSSAVTDAELFEAIKEMGKTNAVILVVKDDSKNKEAYENCEVGEILDNQNSSNISFETSEDVGGFKSDHEKSAIFSSKFVSNDNLINERKLISSYDDSDINESGELEIGEFRNGGLKIAGEIGKSNAEVIKMLQLKNLQDSEDLINTINVQKEEIDRLKKLLLYERANR